MSALTHEIVELVEMLPENEQNLAYELIKRLVLAWDPDFTKLTPAEKEYFEKAEQEIAKGETVSHDQINWN